MHTHFGALAGLGAFLSVLLFGTLWRLGAAYAAVSGNATLQRLGQTMAFQY